MRSKSLPVEQKIPLKKKKNSLNNTSLLLVHVFKCGKVNLL